MVENGTCRQSSVQLIVMCRNMAALTQLWPRSAGGASPRSWALMCPPSQMPAGCCGAAQLGRPIA